MGKKVLAAAVTVLGLACALTGFFVLTGEELKSISGMCTGIGSAAFGLGLGYFIRLVVVPETERIRQARQKDIDVHDERNVRIREKAGAMANRVIFYALCAALLVFGFFGDLRAVLVITGIIVLESVLVIVLSDHYSKQI